MLSALSSKIFTLFNRIENNNNADIATNGESRFLEALGQSLGDDLVLFDVGGNVGEYSKRLLSITGEKKKRSIHVFEPTASCFAILKEKFQWNPNVVLNNVGVSDQPQTATIFYDRERSGFASLYQRDLQGLNVVMDHSETIRLIRLDQYITEHTITHIDFMKIDIEGHELKAFEGIGEFLRPDFIRGIQFEYGGANLDSRTNLRDFFRLFEPKGFVICKIMKHGIEQRPYRAYMDNFQYANYLALSPELFASLNR